MTKLLDGTRWGSVFPPRPAIPIAAVDGRTAVLERFADYLHCIVFRKLNPPGPPEDYQIPRERFLVEYPDDDVQPMKFPTIVFEPGRYTLDPKGLTPAADEGSRDEHGPGTVLVCSDEYVERVVLVIWASTRAQRRAILAGVEWACHPVEEMAGVRLRVPAYYGQTAHFLALEGQNIDDEDSGRRRRRTEMVFEMRFDLVTLRRVVEIAPRAEVATYEKSDPSYESALAAFPRRPPT